MEEVGIDTNQWDGLNFSFIALIPKKKALKHINDYQPIDLLINPLKIMVKVLANRLAPKLQELVGDE